MLTKLIFRNLLYNWGATLLSIILLSTGVGIISFLLVLNKQVEDKFNRDLKDIDLVVGAKGSPLQLVLSAVYHLDAPTGNISRKDAAQLMHHPMIEQAIPLAYGDNFEGYRIVGTDSTYLNKYEARFAKGKIFSTAMEVVLGSNIADTKNMGIGNTFMGTHGLSKESDDIHKHFNYKVVGILQPTGTVLDNLVLTQIESVWMVHEEHEKHEAHSEHKDHDHAVDKENKEQAVENEITALLLTCRTPQAMFVLPRLINENTNMQSASPTLEINRLMGLLGIGTDTIKMVATILILVAGLSIFISLYNRMTEKKYELALARSLGCSRWKLFTIVLSEGMLLCTTGFIAGELLSFLAFSWLKQQVADEYLYTISVKYIWGTDQLLLFAITIFIGIVAAFIPSLKAYYLNISKTLADA